MERITGSKQRARYSLTNAHVYTRKRINIIYVVSELYVYYTFKIYREVYTVAVVALPDVVQHPQVFKGPRREKRALGFEVYEPLECILSLKGSFVTKKIRIGSYQVQQRTKIANDKYQNEKKIRKIL